MANKKPKEGDWIKIDDGKGNIIERTYHVPPAAPTDEDRARQWRNMELLSTDNLAMIPDHPSAAEILEYRSKLRKWPEQKSFPKTRPTRGPF